MVSDASDRNIWGVIAAFVGVVVFSILLGAGVAVWHFTEEEQNSSIFSYSNADKGKGAPQLYPSPRSGIPAVIEGAISNPQPTTGQDHNKRELAAQEASTAFAWWMVVISGLGFCVTTIGTFLLYQQIRLTRKALADTKAATGVVIRQMELTERDSSPFVSVNEARFKQTGPDCGEIEFYVENVGRSPGVEVYLTCDISGFMPEGQFYEERIRVGKKGGDLHIPKGDRKRVGALGTGKIKVIWKIEKGQQMHDAVVVSGFVLYDTVDRRSFYSKFFFFIYEHEWKIGMSIPMHLGGLEIDVFQPYHGPNVRERDGY
jgi:hypothetical protein